MATRHSTGRGLGFQVSRVSYIYDIYVLFTPLAGAGPSSNSNTRLQTTADTLSRQVCVCCGNPRTHGPTTRNSTGIQLIPAHFECASEWDLERFVFRPDWSKRCTDNHNTSCWLSCPTVPSAKADTQVRWHTVNGITLFQNWSNCPCRHSQGPETHLEMFPGRGMHCSHVPLRPRQ